jgi:methylmalonyl-CoA mutase C-terminal domain/subunit
MNAKRIRVLIAKPGLIGLSILSGSHLPLCKKLKELLPEYELDDKLWIVGGNIPKQDREDIKRLGVAAVFPTGTPLQSIVDFIHEKVA